MEDKNVEHNFDEEVLEEDVETFLDWIKNGNYPISAINIFERFVDGPGEDYDFYFGGLIKSNIHYVGSTLYDHHNNLELDAAIISSDEQNWYYRDEQNLQLKFYLEQK